MDINGASVAAPIIKAAQGTAAEPGTSSNLSSKPVDAPKDFELPKSDDISATKKESAPGPSPQLAQPPVSGPSAASEAPKPASVEDAPDTEGPNATGGPSYQKPAPPAPQQSTAMPSVNSADAGRPLNQPSEAPKPAVVSDRDDTAMRKFPLADEDASKDAQVKPSLNEPSPTAQKVSATLDEASRAPVAAAQPVPSASGEREAAPQAIPAEQKPESKSEDDKKRKADVLDSDVSPQTGADGQLPAGGNAANKKNKPGQPPAASNGTSADSHENHESLGHKLVKKAKKVFPAVGRTERKTRSQGPA